MTKPCKLSIIIVNYNSGEFLSRNLSSIQAQMEGISCEVIVVDNASSDGSVPEIQKHFPEAKVVLNPKNLGFAAAINQGLRLSQGENLLWLNPDSEILDRGFADLLRYLDENPEVGVIGPQILNPDGSVQLSCRSFPSYETALFNRYSLLTRLFPANPVSRKYLNTDWNHDSVKEVDWVSGACLLHRRSLLEEIGGLDEAFFMYAEDVDFCLRVKKAGWQVLYHPGAKVLHHIAGSSRKAPRRMIAERHRSMWRYYKKHYTSNFFKDFIVGSVIATRCFWMILFHK